MGCSIVSFQEASAPSLPCDADEIAVTQVEGGKAQNSPVSWEATCGERRYLCSRIHQRTICDIIPQGMQLDRSP
jgi:hypothetical protein